MDIEATSGGGGDGQTGTSAAPQPVEQVQTTPAPVADPGPSLSAAPQPAAGTAPEVAQAGPGAAPPAPGSSTAAPAAPPAEDWQVKYRAAEERARIAEERAWIAYETYQRQQAERQAADRQAQLRAEQERLAQEAKKPWFAPEGLTRDVLTWVTRDETGQLVPKPGAPVDAVVKAQQYLDSYQRFQADLFENPEKLLADRVARIAEEKARQIVEQRFGSYQQEVQSQQIIGRHAGWAFQTDPATGRQTLTPAGEVYSKHLDFVAKADLSDVAVQDQLAYALTQRDAALAALQRAQAGQTAAQTSAQQKQQFVDTAARAATAAPATPPSTAPAPPAKSLSWDQRLAAELRAQLTGSA